ncbi:Hypothetical protein A7982_05888 [Minicystis rosea]|nr:Hypothetical protein A7982_05888 [Minicystis rosea]
MRSGVVAAVVTCLSPSAAWAGDPPPDAAASVAQCVASHTAVQELRKKRLLLQARDALKGCLMPQCPALVRSDCYGWTDELEKETPSVIFNVTSQTTQIVDARILVDGAAVEPSASGNPLKLDPGRHTYSVQHAGYKALTREFVVFAGQRFLQLNIEIDPLVDPKAQAAAPAQPAMETYRPVPAVTYVFLAVGVAGAASFAGFASAGQKAQRDLESTCSPRCTDDQIRSSGVRWKYLAADVSMGLGAAGLVASGLALLLRPTKERPVSASVVPSAGGVFGTLVIRGM